MKLIALLLFIMIVLTLVNGLVFMKKLIKLQKENNRLLKEIAKNKNIDVQDSNAPMPHTELEKYKTQFMQNPYQPPK
jgi:CDP-diacylglycerol pyrophosphatase|tara:strand:+ start:183 stop:413 length:231 start_codon:yes stop_codon:yes gene_type:complete